MCKLDLKDGYWQMIVPKEAEANFAFVLPTNNDDDEILIVVPSPALKMSWKP
jgi:hypothetical protein